MAHPLNSMQRRHDEYITPKNIIDRLGEFDLDPCAAIGQPWKTADLMLTVADQGFLQEWEGRVFLNPPYGREVDKWMEKLSRHGNGVALIFARTETRFFHKYIFPLAHSILFLKGRIHFYNVAGVKYPANAGAPSCLVAYGRNNTEFLKECGIPGKLIILN